MDGLGFVRRGLILGLSAGIAGTAAAQAKPHSAAPTHLNWQYYRVPNGPYIAPGVGRGAFIGPAWGPGFGGGFPGYFGIPGAAGSVWTNNLSLYGPPIPTYAPVPGVFGQNDMSRLFFDQPPPSRFYGYGGGFGYGAGLGWGGRYSPSPRGPVNVGVYPPAASSVTVAGNDGSSPVGVIRVCVRLHNPDAVLWVERQEMKLAGTERVFESSGLEAGQSYRYELIAKWKTGGRDQAETRHVTARPGELVTVDFTVPE